MKIDYLQINSEFKNLEGVRFDFDETDLMTVIIGRNGSGKSNVLEALALIFRNLDLGEKPPFSYKLKYILKRGNEPITVLIDANTEEVHLKKQYKITTSINGEFNIKSIDQIKRDKKTGEAEFLPNHVFAYYSGPGNRLEKYFEKHRTNYYSSIISDKNGNVEDIRPLFYAKPYHSQFVLLAFLLSDKNGFEKQFLKKYLRIESFDSVHFVLRKPAWGRNKGDIFWGAREGPIRAFLNKLLEHSMAPLKIKREEYKTLTGKGVENDFLHLFIPDLKTFKRVCSKKQESGKLTQLEPLELFNQLESIYLSGIIAEINVRVKISGVKEPVTLSQLSEGEQQLLTVLGLIHFTGSDNALFLLDEPDTHLNPAWSIKYLGFINKFLPKNDNSQLLMVSHHPLTIAGLEKKQVLVIKKEDSNVIAKIPEKSPKGMGVEMLLKSDIFGLETSLDQDTHEILKKRNKLACRISLSEDQEEELKELNKKLYGLGFHLSRKDPDYMDFLFEKYHWQESQKIKNDICSTLNERMNTKEEQFENSIELVSSKISEMLSLKEEINRKTELTRSELRLNRIIQNTFKEVVMDVSIDDPSLLESVISMILEENKK